MSVRLSRRPKTEEEIIDDVTYEANLEEAFRIAEEMKVLAVRLQEKASDLKKELDRGQKRNR